MKITLCTSPHLDRSALFDGRHQRSRGEPLRIAQSFLPMGLLSLAAAVKDIADVDIFDINKQLNAGALPLHGDLYGLAAESILTHNPGLVGFMTECDSFHHVLRICAALKVRQPRLLIVLGCVHASYCAPEILSRYGFVDFIIRGEGEVAFRQLVEALAGEGALSGVGNLSYRRDGELCANGELPLIADLDCLPFVDPDLCGVEPADAVWIEIGRGCPFKCNFCVTAPYWHRRHRIKSPARILKELEFYRDRYGRRDFNFTHDLFTTDRRWVLRFSAALEEAELGITWTCSSRTDTLDEEQLATMARAGCRDIYFGVETGTSVMQNAIDKGLELAEARRIIELCHRYGVGTTVGFIAGLPGETEESLSGTLREAAFHLEQPRTVVHLFGYCPYRGSSGFNSIAQDLVPEIRFVDFPVDSTADIENRALIRAHRDVFARYSRLSAHCESGFAPLLEVAEEYFPIQNAVPQLVSYLLRAGIDPYDQLCAWADWLRRRREETEPRYDGHLGTIDEFLEFAEAFAAAAGKLDRRLEDVLRWERIKQEFRSFAPGTELPLASCGSNDTARVRRNPTLRIEEFRYAPGDADDGGSDPVNVAFLRRRDGEAVIVKIGPLAQAIIQIAERFPQQDEIAAMLGSFPNPGEAACEGARGTAAATFDQLVSTDILLFEPA